MHSSIKLFIPKHQNKTDENNTSQFMTTEQSTTIWDNRFSINNNTFLYNID